MDSSSPPPAPPRAGRARGLPAARPGPGTALVRAGGLVVLLLVTGFLQSYHWNIATGVLFAALWFNPRRLWPWLFAAAILARCLMGVVIGIRSGTEGAFLGYWLDPLQFVMGNVLEPFLVAVGVALMQAWQVDPRGPVTTGTIGRLNVAALVAAFALTAKDLAYVAHERVVADVRLGLIHDAVPLQADSAAQVLSAFAASHVLGYFIGIMVLLPLLRWLLVPAHREGSLRIVLATLVVLVPLAAGLAYLGLRVPGPQFAELMRLVLVLAVALFAWRYGWRGAAAAVVVASAAIEVEEILGISTLAPIWMQSYLAVAGAISLLLGAAVDDLAARSADLHAARRKEQRLLAELQEAALRNLELNERERRRVARELHDEFGQNLAAMQTHLKLAAPALAESSRPGLVDGLLDLTRTMQQNIARVLADLRPASLEELGLYGAIDRGSPRQLAQAAGLAFEVELLGDARLLAELDATHATAIYRMAQEAVTNVVRHAQARRCRLRMRINRRDGALWVFLDVRDDGLATPRMIRRGNGLRGMRDRVLALNGAITLRPLNPGLRLHLLVRQGLTLQRRPDAR